MNRFCNLLLSHFFSLRQLLNISDYSLAETMRTSPSGCDGRRRSTDFGRHIICSLLDLVLHAMRHKTLEYPAMIKPESAEKAWDRYGCDCCFR